LALLAAAAITAGHVRFRTRDLGTSAPRVARPAPPRQPDEDATPAASLAPPAPELSLVQSPDAAQIIAEAMTRAGLDAVGASSFGKLDDGSSNAAAVDAQTMLLDALRNEVAGAQEGSEASEDDDVEHSLPWRTWRQLSQQLDQSAQILEDLHSYEQADVLRTAAAQLRRDARAAEGTTTLR
jgi:hypothetical protein